MCHPLFIIGDDGERLAAAARVSIDPEISVPASSDAALSECLGVCLGFCKILFTTQTYGLKGIHHCISVSDLYLLHL